MHSSAFHARTIGRPRPLTGLVLGALGLCGALTAPAAQATDGQRQGFLIGFAGGVVDTDVSVDPDPLYTYTEGNDPGYVAKLTIGGGIGNRVAIAGTLQQTHTDIDGNNHDTHLLGLTGTFWLHPGSGSPYGSLTLGRQTMRADIFEDRFEFSDSESVTGDAARIAIGYEFRDNLLIEAALTAVEANGYTRDGADVSVRQLQLMGGWHWY